MSQTGARVCICAAERMNGLYRRDSRSVNWSSFLENRRSYVRLSRAKYVCVSVWFPTRIITSKSIMRSCCSVIRACVLT